MSEIKIEKTNYKNYGECLKLSNGIIEVLITLDVGPRILSLRFKNGENFFREDIDRNTCSRGELFNAVYGEGKAWYLYGGHRVWISPEDFPATYYPDNEPVSYSEITDGVELTPPPQLINNLQFKTVLTLSKHKSTVKVRHYATNLGEGTKRNALWAVTAMGLGGLEIIPQPVHRWGPTPNRIITAWNKTDLSDSRIYWGKKYITLRQDVEVKSPIKLGINNICGWSGYFINNGLFIKKHPHNLKGTYPDCGVSYETYTNDNVLEMETLGELVDITPGSTICHAEEWQLIDNVTMPSPNDEMTMDELVKLYIGQ